MLIIIMPSLVVSKPAPLVSLVDWSVYHISRHQEPPDHSTFTLTFTKGSWDSCSVAPSELVLGTWNSVIDKDFIMHGLLNDWEEDTQRQWVFQPMICGNTREWLLLTTSTSGDELCSNTQSSYQLIMQTESYDSWNLFKTFTVNILTRLKQSCTF